MRRMYSKKQIEELAGGAPEGTSIKSTSVTSGKVLTADGDGTSSWQDAGGAPEGTSVKSTGVSANQVLQADGDGTSSWTGSPTFEDATVENLFAGDEIEFSDSTGDFGTNAKAKIKDAVGVEANPSETATGTLNKLGIDGVVYSVGGGGGGSTLYQHNISLSGTNDDSQAYRIECSIISTSSTELTFATIKTYLYGNGMTSPTNSLAASGAHVSSDTNLPIVCIYSSATVLKYTCATSTNKEISSSPTWFTDKVVQIN